MACGLFSFTASSLVYAWIWLLSWGFSWNPRSEGAFPLLQESYRSCTLASSLPPPATGLARRVMKSLPKVNCVFQMFLVESGGAVTARDVISVASHGLPWGMRASIVQVDGESATGCEPPAPRCEIKAKASEGKHSSCSSDAGCSTDGSRSEAWPESRALQKYQPLEWMRIHRATPLTPVVKYI